MFKVLYNPEMKIFLNMYLSLYMVNLWPTMGKSGKPQSIAFKIRNKSSISSLYSYI